MDFVVILMVSKGYPLVNAFVLFSVYVYGSPLEKDA